MESLLISVALGLLVALGVAFVRLLSSGQAQSSLSLVVGYGLIAGLIGVPVVMRFLDALGLTLSFVVSGTAVAFVTGLLLFFAYRRNALFEPALREMPRELRASSYLSLMVIAALLMLLCLRLYLLAMEVVWNPLYPWDATMHWATKSRVWFEHLELRPFLENADWLTTTSAEAYTDHHPGYPITIPLLQVWMTSAVGSWDESAMNLPWVLCFVGLGFAFYGQSRSAGASVLVSLAFTYFLLSMPLLNTHVALAGYADFFLGACYCLAIMAFHNWSVSRQRFQAILASVFTLSCLLIKNEGFFWALTFIPALLAIFVPGRRAWALLAIGTAVAILVLFFFPKDLVVAGHSLNELQIFYRDWALKSIFGSVFLHDNWHLFAYLMVGLLVLTGLFRRTAFASLQGISVALLAALVLYLFLFVFTAYSGGALQLTAVGRITLQLVPAGMFYCLLLANALLNSSENVNSSRV